MNDERELHNTYIRWSRNDDYMYTTMHWEDANKTCMLISFSLKLNFNDNMCQDSLLVYLSILHLDRKCQKVWNVKWGRFLQVSVNLTIKKLSYLFLGNGAEFLMSQVVDQENDPVWVVMVWYFHSTGSRKI